MGGALEVVRPMDTPGSSGADVLDDLGHKKEALASCLRELAEAYHQSAPWALENGAFVDQLGWRVLHARDYPKLQVDYRSLIFKRYDVFREVLE